MNTKKFSFFDRRLMFEECRRSGKIGKYVDETCFTAYQHLRDIVPMLGGKYFEHSVLVCCESNPGDFMRFTGSYPDVERSFSFGFTV